MPTQQTKFVTLRGRWEFIIIGSLFAFSMIVTAKLGADAYRYFDWERYFVSFDLSALNDYPKSPRGLPLDQWQYGAGLLSAMPSMVFRIPSSMLAAGALLGIANLLLFFIVARTYAKRWDLLILATASLLLFTPAGYYFNAYSSESWTILLTLCGLCCIEWNRRHPHSLYYYAFLLGVTCYFLLLVRSTNIIICSALLLIYLSDFHASDKPNSQSWQLLILTLASPPIIALGFLGTLNYFINGSIFDSPYLVKDPEYSFFSLGHLKITEVLFSSWHGLFFYHPLFAIAIYWLIRPARNDAINVIVLIALALQMVVQSSFYVWWMGLGTFGARAFCGVSILLLYAVLRCHQDRLLRILGSSRNLLILAAFATFEAFLICKGYTNFSNYESFIRDAGTRSSLFIVAALFAYGLSVFCVVRWLAVDSSRYWLMYIVGLYPFASLMQWRVNSASLIGTHDAKMVAAITLVVAAIALISQLRFLADLISRISGRYSAQVLFASAVFAFVLSIFAQTVMLMAFSAQASSNFRGGHAFDCNEAVASFREYNRVQGYERDKAALLAFLTRSGCFTTTQPVPATAEPPK